MFFVGIDVASQKHDCCVLDAQGKVCAEFQFRNNREGFDYLFEILSQLDSAENIKIGLEATGIYSTNLLAFLRRNGFEATTFNPLHIKKRLSATTLRKTKTDKSDAKFIADTVMHETSQPDTPVSYHISELKSLTRFRFQLVQDCSRAKIQAKAALPTLFPEFSSAFSDVFGASAKAILSKYPSAADVANCRISSLEKVLSSASRGRFGRAKAEELKQLAKQSIGVFSAAKALALQSYLQQIQLFEAQVAEVDRQIKAIMDEIDSPILSVPGIGYTLGATILAEIGDVRRFSSPAKLLAFAGMEPSIYQSGNFKPSSGKMVKRGSPHLRWALGQAARLVPQYTHTFSLYLDKKLSENKHYSVATSHVAKKLVRVLFAILSKDVSFSDNISHFAA